MSDPRGIQLTMVRLYLGGIHGEQVGGPELIGYIDGSRNSGMMYLGPRAHIQRALTTAQNYGVQGEVVGVGDNANVDAKWMCEYLSNVNQGESALKTDGVRLRIKNEIK